MNIRVSLIVVAMLAFAAPVSAQNYPTKPIRFIVPFTPGGNTDVQARLIGNKLTSALGQQVIVDNRGGAGGTLGVDMAAKAQPDGHTIVLASFGNILVGPALYKNLPYDPVKDFEPVVLVSEPPGMIVVHPSVPVKSLREFIDYAKKNPNKLNYASAGNGTWNHLFAEQLKAVAGIQMAHVPYKGAGPAMNDVVGGHVPTMFAPFPQRAHPPDGQPPARPRSDRRQTLTAVPGCADGIGSRVARLYRGQLVRHPRPRGHAQGHRHAPEQGSECRVRRAGCQGGLCRRGHRPGRRHSGRHRTLDPRGR
jgi:hypothetical protein